MTGKMVFVSGTRLGGAGGDAQAAARAAECMSHIRAFIRYENALSLVDLGDAIPGALSIGDGAAARVVDEAFARIDVPILRPGAEMLAAPPLSCGDGPAWHVLPPDALLDGSAPDGPVVVVSGSPLSGRSAGEDHGAPFRAAAGKRSGPVVFVSGGLERNAVEFVDGIAHLCVEPLSTPAAGDGLSGGYASLTVELDRLVWEVFGPRAFTLTLPLP